jgi:hypothetical protein
MVRGPGRREGGGETMDFASRHDMMRRAGGGVESTCPPALAMTHLPLGGRLAMTARNPIKRAARCTIYFIRSGDDGAIKIGRTLGSARERLAALQTSIPTPLFLVATIIGADPSLEQRLHRRFRHLRVRGEWFRPEAELMRFIGEKASPCDDEPESAPKRLLLGVVLRGLPIGEAVGRVAARQRYATDPDVIEVRDEVIRAMRQAGYSRKIIAAVLRMTPRHVTNRMQAMEPIGFTTEPKKSGRAT